MKVFTNSAWEKLKGLIGSLSNKVSDVVKRQDSAGSAFKLSIVNSQETETMTPVTSIPGVGTVYANLDTDYPSSNKYYSMALAQNEDGSMFKVFGRVGVRPNKNNVGNKVYALKTNLKLNYAPKSIIDIYGFKFGYYTETGKDGIQGIQGAEGTVARIGTDGYLYVLVTPDASYTSFKFDILTSNAFGGVCFNDNFKL